MFDSFIGNKDDMCTKINLCRFPFYALRSTRANSVAYPMADHVMTLSLVSKLWLRSVRSIAHCERKRGDSFSFPFCLAL